ncbi:MAG: hypothetical protein P1U56_20040 [Saprospiraceae bacterium]|nr:hypothetical protein [Saprospiraceae bacterium]
MLSKFIYRFLAVALLALVTQVGISQNYVGSDAAEVILTQEIADVEAELEAEPAYTGSFQFQGDKSNERISLLLMRAVKEEIATNKAVKSVMDAWYQKANTESVSERKTKLLLALDKVKELLS